MIDLIQIYYSDYANQIQIQGPICLALKQEEVRTPFNSFNRYWYVDTEGKLYTGSLWWRDEIIKI